ncbi:hypothetical protein KUH03_01975 [Sphingobacterium sp. E70]|uniref:hypothetical protein n=1 Tax=Sphingobacterium sp. E70 TaxID=2853439 RepID=UPI00211BB335|nr:hypothetical protein [Sphingobacterium sp. E70]ULT25789.1 hypothetical protein KUH03_01975 [Sphingobacterium sp. E70]
MECKNDISEKAKDAATGPRIVLNTYSGNTIEGEAFVADHIFSYILQENRMSGLLTTSIPIGKVTSVFFDAIS